MHQGIELLEKLNGVEIFPPAMLIGQPLARLARVVEVEHRSDRIDAQAIEMKFGQPPMRRGEQETTHLMPAVVENMRSPIGVQAKARVFVFVERRAVIASQRPLVLRKMAGHPVENDAQAGLMAAIDEKP